MSIAMEILLVQTGSLVQCVFKMDFKIHVEKFDWHTLKQVKNKRN